MQRLRAGIKKQAVHGEVPAFRVGPGVGKHNLFRTAPVPVIALGAKRGDLKLPSLFDYDHYPEFSANGDGFRKKFFDLRGPGGSGDIEILRLAAEQKITHAAPYPKSGKARLLEALHHGHGGFAQRAAHRVIFMETRAPAKLIHPCRTGPRRGSIAIKLYAPIPFW